jgi:hypothetical protein
MQTTTFNFCYNSIFQEKVDSEDYYFNERGFMVFTAAYHKKRGYCCGNGCKHCVYNFDAVADTTRRKKLLDSQKNKS